MHIALTLTLSQRERRPYFVQSKSKYTLPCGFDEPCFSDNCYLDFARKLHPLGQGLSNIPANLGGCFVR